MAQIKKMDEVNLKPFFLLNSVWGEAGRKERRIIWFPRSLKDADRDRQKRAVCSEVDGRTAICFFQSCKDQWRREIISNRSWELTVHVCVWRGGELVTSDLFHNWNAVWTTRHSHLAVSWHQVHTVPTWPNMLGPADSKTLHTASYTQALRASVQDGPGAQLPSGNLQD